ncbi:adhesin [Streptomyces sp. NPDC003023]|uniref:adhesin n=1 Tax=Streptomyces sp. NPDC003023 TaxID=3364675 RepID=UPI00369FCF67
MVFKRWNGWAVSAGGVALLMLTPAVAGCQPSGGGPSSAGAPAPGTEGDPSDLGGAPDRIVPTEEPEATRAPARPSPKPPTGPKEPATPGRPPYSAWAGPGCTGGGGYRESGRVGDGFDGWYTVRSGGHRGDGCDGRFTAIPVSGSRTEDSGGTATWSWYVGSGYRTCSVAVVVPVSDRDRDVAGEPTTYHVLSDPDDPGSVVKAFDIDRTRLRGTGLVVEKVPVHDQRLTVQLVDRGGDRGGEGRDGAHHAAAQMRAECRA